ncbi:MAG: permease prefix domain 1-containing protein [Spirochaetaceae bacterium]|nr:permease prefix domain 1-containing protein [Spirochaetaceae bacterium]
MTNQKTKQFVDSLWASYEETARLADFKAELAGNLDEKISSLVKKGLDEDAAFQKAAAELGDISSLADEMALQKKQEVLEEAFMDIRRYMNTKRILAYIAFGLIFLFGIIVAVITLYSVDLDNAAVPASNKWTAFFGVLLAFIPVSIAGWTFLGLTQELPDLYPLSIKRALWYSAAALLLITGLFIFPLTWFSTVDSLENHSIVAALGTLIPFALPSIALFVYLGLSEKDRSKPWMRKRREEEMKKYSFASDPAAAAQFGMYCGALWMLAIALFLLLGFLIGFKYSWLVFVFAIPVQLFVQGIMTHTTIKSNGQQ